MMIQSRSSLANFAKKFRKCKEKMLNESLGKYMIQGYQGKPSLNSLLREVL